MTANRVLDVSNAPTDEELRATVMAIINDRYGARGVKGFAADAGVPYDRVRDHLSGATKWKVIDLLSYCEALGVTLEDLFKLREALRAARPTD